MKTRLYILILLGLSPVSLFAQAAPSEPGLANELLIIIYVIAALMLWVTYFLWKVSIHLKKYMRGEFETEEQKMYDSRSFWEKFFQIKPVGTDRDVVMDHEYDGIRELDNPAPPWFMAGFYITIVIAVIYFIRFSVTGDGPTQEEEYLAEMAKFEVKVSEAVAEQGADVDENTVTLLTESTDIDKGKRIYLTNCKICHMDAGAGGTGPNLTDQYWLHGGGIKNIFKTVKYGVISKGMNSWKGTLTPLQIQQVSSYIMSLEGTNPPGGIDPQGEIWVPEDIPAVIDSLEQVQDTVVNE
ncbi:c-type cytochrome [bacterium]|nr:c-type cytochrome [bacterium]